MTGGPVVVNVQTAAFPASLFGDARIADTVELPVRCLAPVVFVTSGANAPAATGNWFAITGQDPAGEGNQPRDRLRAAPAAAARRT